MLRRSKYGSRKTNGYDSRKEHARAAELHLMQKMGLISDLQEQVRVELVPKQEGERAVHWVADFKYKDASGHEVWEDCKGFKTPDYIIKRKLFQYRYGIKIRET